MPRLNTADEVLAIVTEIGILEVDTATPASTTVDTSVAEGATALTVVDGTDFANGDLIQIGSAPEIEVAEIEAGGGTASLTLKSPLAYAYGARPVVRVTEVPIGDLTEDGVRVIHEGSDVAVRSGTRKGIWTYLPSNENSIRMTFGLLNISMENMAEFVGQDPADISGAGTAADPYVLDIRENDLATQPARVWYFNGAREDGTIVRVECNAAQVVFADGELQFTQGQAANIPFNLRIQNGYRVAQYS